MSTSTLMHFSSLHRSLVSLRCPFLPTKISHSIDLAMEPFRVQRRNHLRRTQMSQCGQLAQFWIIVPWIQLSQLTKVRHQKRRFFHLEKMTRSTKDIHVIRQHSTVQQLQEMRHTMDRQWNSFKYRRKTTQVNRWERISHFCMSFHPLIWISRKSDAP